MEELGAMALVSGALILGAVIGAHLHEFTHYLLIRFSTPDVSVNYGYYIFPDSNTLHSPLDIDPNWFRFCAIAPILWSCVAILCIVQFWPPNLLELILIFAPVCAAIMTSPGDIFGFILTAKTISIQACHVAHGQSGCRLS